MGKDNITDISITQHNEIIESCYTMDLIEKRLMFLIKSKINPLKLITDPPDITVSLEEWEKYYPAGSSLRDFKKTALSILGKRITFNKNSTHHNNKIAINWFESVEYNDFNITIKFTKPIWVRLCNIDNCFTKIHLLNVSKMTSLYSIRLYECIIQYLPIGHRKIYIDDFRFMLDLQKKYTTTRKLKESVLKKAIKEINDKSNLNVEYEDIKKGRVITGFIFYIKLKEHHNNLSLPV